MQDLKIHTSAGTMHVVDTGGDGPAVVFVHGNSSSTKVFDHLLRGELGRELRLLAIDLPGHGASEDAGDPETFYTPEGHGANLAELLERLELPGIVLVGWSLGGHVVLESLAAGVTPLGAMIIGAPPLDRKPDAFPRAFLPHPCAPLAMQETFSPEEVERFARTFFGPGVELPDFVVADCLRTDGLARTHLFAGLLQGRYADEAALVRSSSVPLAVMVGAEDDIVNIEYVRSLEYANLWRGEVLSPPGSGHAPFWEVPDTFAAILREFVTEVTRSSFSTDT